MGAEALVGFLFTDTQALNEHPLGFVDDNAIAQALFEPLQSNAQLLLAARCLGVPGGRIMTRHILPNSMTALIVQATLGIATAIIEAAALGFLGLGAQPPAPEWGLMLNTLRQAIYVNPVLAALPGVMIFLTSICFNLMSDGLRAAMDMRG